MQRMICFFFVLVKLVKIVFDAFKAGIITEKVALKIFKTFKAHSQDFWIKPLVIDAAIAKIGSGAGP